MAPRGLAKHSLGRVIAVRLEPVESKRDRDRRLRHGDVDLTGFPGRGPGVILGGHSRILAQTTVTTGPLAVPGLSESVGRRTFV